MTDSSGAVVWSADYNPFGAVNITTNTITNNLRFPGQYSDAETGLHYNYYRDYNPAIGRYPEADRIGLKGGLNLYSYVGNNPQNWVDPLGLFVVTVNYGNSPYSSVTMVWNSWLPSFYTSGTIGGNGTNIQSGIYNYQYGQHPMNPDPGQDPYPALNLYTQNGSRTLPATRTDGPGTTATGINVHSGNPTTSRRSGSQGCHVIPQSNWNNFISQFGPGDSGTYIYIRLGF